MSDTSPILSLPYIQPAQAQKHVTHNEALRLLDILVQLVVLSRDQIVPPAVPAAGDCHIVGAAATGPWVGQDRAIAFYEAGGWQFLVPKPGWRAHVLAENRPVVFDTVAGWQDGSNAAFLTLGVGVNATADTTNRLTVAATATLLNHAGAGHQLKINKATVTDTASLLFQTGFSGRAEMGLAGDDAFAIKVSPSGTGFVTALAVEPATGRVQMPQGLTLTGTLTGTAAARLGGLRATRAGTANAITLAYGLSALSAGIQVRFTTTTTNTGATTINLDGLGAIACRTVTGVALPSGYIRTVVETVATYDGTFWVLDRLVENGSNANGTFKRFADGDLVCTSPVFSSQDPTIAAGSIFRTAALGSWTLPATALDANGLVIGGPAGANASTHWVNGRMTSTTNAEFTVFAPASITGRAIRLKSENRWY